MKKLITNFKKFIKDAQATAYLEEREDLIKEMSKTHLFRFLNGKEEEAVQVQDNRDIT